MAGGVRAITRDVEGAFPELDERDRNLCVAIALASWALELDKVGSLDMRPRDAAYVYQAGRIAAQELPPRLQPRLRSMIDAMRWPRSEQGAPVAVSEMS